jgi:sugar lactone lactonase YvrE
MHLEVLFAGRFALAESPVYDRDLDRLIWVDIATGTVWATSFGHAEDARPIGQYPHTVGAACLTADPDVLVVAHERGIGLLETGGHRVELFELEAENAQTRMNDAQVDPRGRLWAGTMHREGDRGHGSLYLIDPYGPKRVLSSIGVSNGLAWSPDGTVMYYVDSLERRVDRLLVDDDGRVADRREAIDCSPYPGLPDGLTVDRHGGIWVVFWAGSTVRRFSAAGDLTLELATPTTHPTSCTFAGPDLDHLVITSSTYDAGSALAGSLFVTHTDVHGTPPRRWLGPVNAPASPPDR